MIFIDLSFVAKYATCLFKKTFLYASVCYTTQYWTCYTEKKFCNISKKYTIGPVKICPRVHTFLVLFLSYISFIAFLTGRNPANICRSLLSMGCLLKLNNVHACLSNQLCSFVGFSGFQLSPGVTLTSFITASKSSFKDRNTYKVKILVVLVITITYCKV